MLPSKLISYSYFVPFETAQIVKDEFVPFENLVPLVAVVGGAANTKSAVDDFVKLKLIKSLACVINSSEMNDFLRFYVYLCHMSDILYLSF